MWGRGWNPPQGLILRGPKKRQGSVVERRDVLLRGHPQAHLKMSLVVRGVGGNPRMLMEQGWDESPHAAMGFGFFPKFQPGLDPSGRVWAGRCPSSARQ